MKVGCNQQLETAAAFGVRRHGRRFGSSLIVKSKKAATSRSTPKAPPITVEWLLPFALLLFSPIVHPQQRSPQQEEQVLKLETDLVEIDVVVTDKKGKLADGLKKEDFLLKEEGSPQEISFFSFIRSGAPAAPAQGSSSAALARPEAPVTARLEAGRFFFIVLDQYHIATENYPRLREALSQFLTEDLDPQDQVAVISTTGSLAVFQQASKNKKIVAAAINAFLGRGGDYKSTEAADKAFTQLQEGAGLPAAASLALYQQDILRNTLSSLQRLPQKRNSGASKCGSRTGPI